MANQEERKEHRDGSNLAYITPAIIAVNHLNDPHQPERIEFNMEDIVNCEVSDDDEEDSTRTVTVTQHTPRTECSADVPQVLMITHH